MMAPLSCNYYCMIKTFFIKKYLKNLFTSFDRTIIMQLASHDQTKFWPTGLKATGGERGACLLETKLRLLPPFQCTFSVRLSPWAVVDVTVITALYLLWKVQRHLWVERHPVWVHNILQRCAQLGEFHCLLMMDVFFSQVIRQSMLIGCHEANMSFKLNIFSFHKDGIRWENHVPCGPFCSTHCL